MHRPQILTKRTRWVALLMAGICAMSVAVPTGGATAAEVSPETATSDAPTTDEAVDTGEAADEIGAQGIYHDFRVTNLTGRDMKFTSSARAFSNSDPRFDHTHPPASGTAFPPGLTNLFSLTYWFAFDNGVQMNYSFEGGGSVTLRATVDGYNNVKYTCTYAPASLKCETSGSNATIMSATPNQRAVEPTQPDAQAAALKSLCDSGNPHVRCDFAPKGELVETMGDSKITGDYTDFNCKVATISRKIFTYQIEEGFTTSFGGSVTLSGNINKLVELAVTASFNESWTWNRTVGESRTAEIAPGYWTWLEHRGARLRLVGDFAARIGNDTILIKDVSFEAPNGRAGAEEIMGAHERVMTPEDRVEHCGETLEVARERSAAAEKRNGG